MSFPSATVPCYSNYHFRLYIQQYWTSVFCFSGPTQPIPNSQKYHYHEIYLILTNIPTSQIPVWFSWRSWYVSHKITNYLRLKCIIIFQIVSRFQKSKIIFLQEYRSRSSSSIFDPNTSRIQRLQATRTLPSQYVAASFGTNDFPTTKGQLVIVTDGYNPHDGSRLDLGDSGYNERFTGDIRLLDGGKTRIGQTFPPVGTLGYFAYNSVPDGWLEMVGQSVLFEKSVGFYKYDADGNVIPAEDRADSDFEETIEMNLHFIMFSLGLPKLFYNFY